MSDEKKNPENDQFQDLQGKKDGKIKVNVEVPAWLYPDGGVYIYVGNSNPPKPPGS